MKEHRLLPIVKDFPVPDRSVIYPDGANSVDSLGNTKEDHNGCEGIGVKRYSGWGAWGGGQNRQPVAMS